MGTIIGVIVGYALGAQAGREGWGEFQEALKVIASSEEVRDLLSGALTIARDLATKGGEIFIEVIGESTGARPLRPAA